MITNIWRYSHFALAVSSSLFVLLATITGIVLAFEPIQTKLQPNKVEQGEECRLSDVLEVLNAEYDEVLELEVDANYFVKASVISMDETKDGDFYINPKTGKKLAELPDKKPFFEWVTNFHRSLFFKTPGRIFVGITSFLLFLIAITGCILLIKRQKGIVRFFSKIIKEDFTQYYHIVLGRLMLIPILIITLTGVYLSLFRFSLLPEATGKETVFESLQDEDFEKSFAEFPIFQRTKIEDIRKLEFPFSDDIEETFKLVLKDRKLQINQKTGAVISETTFPFVKLTTDWSFNLHTGKGSIWWSIVLLIASVNILFFMYSGGMISYRRIRGKIKNSFKPEEAEIVILLGTENGSTRSFGSILQKALLKTGKKIFLDDLNHYQLYPSIEHLLILTSTYGDGDPPANANRFLNLLDNIKPDKSFQYAVVGFGSRAYANFCQFALEIDTKLSADKYYEQATPAFLINNKSYDRFKEWAMKWGDKAALKFNLPSQLAAKKEKQYDFKLVEKKTVIDEYDETFILKLEPLKSMKFASGDLLVVYPPKNETERLYSIGKDPSGAILLSIKKHEFGVCSNYLNELLPGSILKAALRENESFQKPMHANSLILIANGTGIAPFLGMLKAEKNIPIQLYWGGRTYKSYELYQKYLEAAVQDNRNLKIETVFSKEDGTLKYVQDLLKEKGQETVEQLNKEGVIMICGSVAMQKEVLELLENIVHRYHNKSLDYFIDNNQILMDCY